MKSILQRLLSLIVLFGLWLLPLACHRTLDYQLETLVPQSYQPPTQGKITVNGPAELNTRVFLIDSSATDQVVSYTGNQLVLKPSIRLRSARVVQAVSIASLQPGDYIISDLSPKTPRGLFKEVTDKIDVGGDVTVTVKDATFEGLFKKVDFSIEGEIAPSISVERKFGSADGVLKGELAIKGDIKPSGALKIELKVEDAVVQHALASLTFKRSVSAGMSATGSVTLPITPFELLRRPLPPIRAVLLVPTPFGIPLPLPIVITPEMVVNANVSAGVEGAFEATLLKLSDEVTYGVSYDLGIGWKTIKDEKPVVNDPSFELKVGGFAQLGIQPEFDFSFYDLKIVTVGINTELYGRLEAACKTDLSKPEEANSLEVKLSAGLKATLFGRFDVASADLKGERKVEGGITFGVIAKLIKSDFCNKKDPDPIANDTQLASVAVSTGDPHLSTFDRTGYSFQAVGEFLAVRPTTTGDNFEIQVRQEPLANSTQVSMSTGLAIRTGSGNEVVCVYPNRVYLNGQNIGTVSGERALSNGGKLIGTSGHLSIRTAQGDQVNVRLFATTLDYDLSLAPTRTGRVKGLFGNYDGAPGNDLTRGDNGLLVQNTYAALYPVYADSWRIKQTESLFAYDTGKTTESYTDRNFPRTAVTLTSQQRTAAEAVCRAAGVTDPLALSNCIIDVALTRDNSLADRALDFQLTNSALNTFSIGEFSTSDVQLDYFAATTLNRSAVLDTRSQGFSRVVMQQGVNIRRGFSTEFTFSTSELNPASCFYLALWPTGTATRSNAQKRVGFCFGFMDEMPTAFFQFDQGSTNSRLATKRVTNFIDGRNHKVRITESLLPNGLWRVATFLDDLITPIYFIDSTQSIADLIGATNRIGYIEFQINKGSPSIVQLFNWKYDAL